MIKKVKLKREAQIETRDSQQRYRRTKEPDMDSKEIVNLKIKTRDSQKRYRRTKEQEIYSKERVN